MPRSKVHVKVLILKPAGKIVEDGSVGSFSYGNPEVIVKTNTNTGDFFVHDATLRLIEAEVVEHSQYKNYEKEEIARLNSEFDIAILRGSNYIHQNYDWSDVLQLIEGLTIPIVAFGIGCQASSKGVELPEQAMRALKTIAEKSTSIGVRGEYTADFLSSIGIKNVDIVGCPSILRRNEPALKVNFKPIEEIRRVGLTTHKSLAGMYCDDPKRTIELQKSLIEELYRDYQLTIVGQGETEEKILFYKFKERYGEVVDRLTRIGWISSLHDPSLAAYSSTIFFGTSALEYAENAKSLDLAIGVRLHGNVMALAHGVPAIFVVYDSRTREFANLFDLPQIDISKGYSTRWQDVYTHENFQRFEKTYAKVYQDVREFLNKNKVKNRMIG